MRQVKPGPRIGGKALYAWREYCGKIYLDLLFLKDSTLYEIGYYGFAKRFLHSLAGPSRPGRGGIVAIARDLVKNDLAALFGPASRFMRVHERALPERKPAAIFQPYFPCDEGVSASMKRAFRLMTLVALAITALVTTAVVPASAAPATISRDQVWSIPDKKTGSWSPIGGYQIELRYGTYNGTQYAWGRVEGQGWDEGKVSFEMSSDGGRKWTELSWIHTSAGTWTTGHITYASSNIKMQACWANKNTNRWCSGPW